MVVITIVITVLAYIAMMHVTQHSIEDKIRHYKRDYLWENGFVDSSIATLLVNEKKTIATYASLVWPLYYPFMFGLTFGKDIYDLLVGEHYEDRIATRFI